jgi:hypothetical protein
MASSAAVITAPSTHPPESEPSTLPLPETSMEVPTGQGTEPLAAMTVATA